MVVCRKKHVSRIRWQYWRYQAQKSDSHSASLKQRVYRQGKSPQKVFTPLGILKRKEWCHEHPGSWHQAEKRFESLDAAKNATILQVLVAQKTRSPSLRLAADASMKEKSEQLSALAL
jgi:hypothetical protein